MFVILIILAKLATPGLLEIKVFWNIGYDVIIPVHDIPKKTQMTSRDSNYVKEVVIWTKFGKSNVSEGKFTTTSFL